MTDKEKIEKYISTLVEEIHKECTEKVFEIYEVFKEFFGEERVDLQGIPEIDFTIRAILASNIEFFIGNTYFQALNNKERTEYLKSDGYTYVSDIPYNILNKLLSTGYVLSMFKASVATHYYNNMFILVWFPNVTITNENDNSVDINNLWAKVPINYSGNIKDSFYLNRSEYQESHFLSNYMHSHIFTIDKTCFMFQKPCLGSGPINHTVRNLIRTYDLDIWKLFCLELSKYVTVESISGTPYNYLEQIDKHREVEYSLDDSTSIFISESAYKANNRSPKFNEFVKYFLSKKLLKFNYVNGCYSLGMSYTQYLILISNCYIEWFNKNLSKFKNLSNAELAYLSDSVLTKCTFKQGKLFHLTERSGSINYSAYQDKKLFTFKNRDIRLKITEIDKEEDIKYVKILYPSKASYILYKVLQIVNDKYGRETGSQEHKDSTKTLYI